MKRIKEFFKKYNYGVIIIIALIFGFAAGLVGEIVAKAYSTDSLFGIAPFGNLDFSKNIYPESGLIISNARNVIVQQDTKVNETINSVSQGLVGIYKKQKPAANRQAFNLENFYDLNEHVGQGFIITADGWIITSMDLTKTYSDFVVITKDRKIYQIDKAIADNLTPFYFLHVPARDFPVNKFAENQPIKSGQIAIAAGWLDTNLVTSVVGLSRPEGLLRSSDSFSEKVSLTDKLPAEFKGTAVFNLAGEIFGLVDGRGEVEPISHLTGAIKSVFINKTNLRPYLGVNYINLSVLAEISKQDNSWQNGVVIYGNQKSPAVRKGSPADKSGLLQGDIIISVDGQELNKDNDLANLIQNRLVGETVSLLVRRNGEEREISVSLEQNK